MRVGDDARHQLDFLRRIRFASVNGSSMNPLLARTGLGLWGVMSVAVAQGADSGLSVEAAASPDVKAEITAGLPAFGQTPKAPDKPAPDAQELQMAAHIKRLPQKPARPPQGEEVLTAKGKADAAMNEYLGKSDDFDRGFINRVTLPELWNKIPLLKYLPCPLPGITNEERAEAIKRDVDFHQALRDEADFSSLDKVEQTAMPAAEAEGK